MQVFDYLFMRANIQARDAQWQVHMPYVKATGSWPAMRLDNTCGNVELAQDCMSSGLTVCMGSRDRYSEIAVEDGPCLLDVDHIPNAAVALLMIHLRGAFLVGDDGFSIRGDRPGSSFSGNNRPLAWKRCDADIEILERVIDNSDVSAVAGDHCRQQLVRQPQSQRRQRQRRVCCG